MRVLEKEAHNHWRAFWRKFLDVKECEFGTDHEEQSVDGQNQDSRDYTALDGMSFGDLQQVAFPSGLWEIRGMRRLFDQNSSGNQQ